MRNAEQEKQAVDAFAEVMLSVLDELDEGPWEDRALSELMHMLKIRRVISGGAMMAYAQDNTPTTALWLSKMLAAEANHCMKMSDNLMRKHEKTLAPRVTTHVLCRPHEEEDARCFFEEHVTTLTGEALEKAKQIERDESPLMIVECPPK